MRRRGGNGDRGLAASLVRLALSRDGRVELQAEMLTVKTRAQKESFYKVIPGQILAKLQQGFLNMQHLPRGVEPDVSR